jgi:hypothetical protein
MSPIRCFPAWVWACVVLVLVAGSTTGARAQGPERPELITSEAEKAIEKGLGYLARTQSRDGSWRSAGGMGSFPVAMSSLAGLALLASGSTPNEGPYSANVRRTVDFLLDSSLASGVIAHMAEESRPMHGHGFAMLFLGEAYGMERNPAQQARIRKVLGKAIDLTGRSQSAAGGWLYTPDSGGDEGSVTVTQIQGLRSCRNAGIKVPKSIIDRAVKYIENSANPDGSIRYRAQMGGDQGRPPITAAAVATLYNAGQYDNPIAIKSLEYLLKNVKGKENQVFAGHVFYGNLYMAQAMYLSGEANWRSFFPAMRDSLVQSQASDGSWNGDSVGTTYGTAIALIILQLPYANLPILQR